MRLKQLIVSVDTEEEGLWGGKYAVSGNTTQNLRGLPRFQDVCAGLSAPPTYLIDAPVLEDQEAIANLKNWQDSNDCEVGAHCHPWCNPPLDQESNSLESFLCNAPADKQYAKLKWLTDEITSKLGRAPTSYRAGRYGFNRTSAEILADLGYIVDSSVLPVHEYRSQGGPDFQFANRSPYQLFKDDEHRQLLEIPVTAGFTESGFQWRRNLWIGLRKPIWKRFRLAGVADRTGLARRIKLSPEGTRMKDLIKLVDSCVEDGLSTLVLMLHSSSLATGFSPYATDEKALAALYSRLKQTVQHAVDHGFQPVTLSEAARRLVSELPSGSGNPSSLESIIPGPTN